MTTSIATPRPALLLRMFLRFAAETGLLDIAGRRQVMDELRVLKRQLERIALDALAAEEDGIGLGEAALDYERFPHLAKFHATVMSMPLWRAPEPLDRWLSQALAGPEPAVVEPLRQLLLEMASQDPLPLRRALARVVLFEGVAFNLRILQLRNAGEFAACAIDHESVGHMAAASLYVWLDEMPVESPPPRSYERLVNLAAHALVGHAEAFRAVFAHLADDLRSALDARALAERTISNMMHPDSAMVRNAVGPSVFEEPRLSPAMMRERLPHMPATDEAYYKRASRKRKALEDGLRMDLLEPLTALYSSKRRFIDVFLDLPAPADRLPKGMA